MNYNSQSLQGSKKRPLSSKIKSKSKPPMYTPVHNKEDQIFLKSEKKNQSLTKALDEKNQSEFNESKELNNEELNDMYNSIQKMWDDLGITELYQLQFHNTIKNLDEKDIKNILINEKKSLSKFGDALLNLSNEIISRDNNVHSLQRDVVALSQNQNIFKEDEKHIRNREKLILEIISYVKALRINSINVINYFLKVREIITYYRLIGKVDMKLINSNFKYSDDYLKKMKRDMDFLKQYKQMHKYFDMNNGEIDAFLTNFDSKPSNNIKYTKYLSNKAKITVSEEMQKEIDQCRYILSQEDIYDKIKQGKVDFNSENNNNYNNFDSNNNNSKSLMTNKFEKSKIRFFNQNEENQKEYPILYENNNIKNNNKKNKFLRIRSNNSSGKINMGLKDREFRERKNMDLVRLNIANEYNNLFKNDKYHNNKYQYKNYNLSNNNNNYNINMNFRRPFLFTNKIKIEREERKKDRIQFFLNDALPQKQDPLQIENKELNKALNDVCDDNEMLNEELNVLKEKIREIERENLEKEKMAKKKEKENQTLFKKMSSDIDELNTTKKNLNNKLIENKNLMDKYNKENNEKINNLNLVMNQQKEDYESKINNLNNINQNLNSQIEELTKDKNDLINLKEQLLKEKNELIEKKNNLEDNITQLEYQISENKKEIENYKNTVNENLQKIEENTKKINELNNDLINLQNDKNDLEKKSSEKIEELSNKITELETTIQNNQETINNLENIKNQLTNEKNELFNSDNNAKMQINNLNDQINNLNIQINDKDEQINNLQTNLKDYNSLKDENIKMKNELEQLKEQLKKYIPNYKCDFYRGNLYNLIDDISTKLSLDKIPEFMKESFNLEEINIFEEKTYLKGVYPKIIISTLENNGEITGVCSVYYENYGQVGEPLTLRIDALCVLEQNWEIQIKNIINFIKTNIFFDEIKYIIKYIPNKENGKLKLDEKIKVFFKKELKCSWKNVINYANGTRTQEIRIVKEGDYFNQDISKTNNNQFFGLNSLSIVSLYERNNKTLIGLDPEKELNDKYSKMYLNKYINHYPILLLLANNPKYRISFDNNEDKNLYEMPQVKEEEEYLHPKTQIKQFSKLIYNLDNISTLKENIPSFNTNNLLCEEVYEKLNSYLEMFSLNYLTMKINLSTPTNFCLNFENYIYNRISSKKIDVLRDTQSKNLFYLIPTNNDSIFIFLSQIGSKLQEELLDKNKNLYKALSELHPKLTNQLLQFSSLNLSYNSQQNQEKTIYIPSFKIDSHLYSFGVKDIKEKGKLINIETNNEENLGSIDECFKLSFEGDKNLKDSFSIIPTEDKKLNLVIRESFLFGIFNIKINEKSPLQLFYVTKDHWIHA